jgi:tripartite-type tricarboxylate transporter receptor subunit TctC
MSFNRLFHVLIPCVLATLTAAAPSSVLAQSANYPTKSITMVVPFGPGSVTDLLARTVAAKLTDVLGQTVIVENKPGADGNIGAAYAALAPADGYTLLVGPASTNAINPSLHKNLRFDPQRDFVAITNLATVTNVLVVGPQVPARSLKELIQALGKHQYSYASSGAGGSMHLSGELFKRMSRTDILHVPYKSGPAAVNDVLGGRVEMMFCNLPVCLPHIRSGKLTAIAVTSPQRSVLLPNVPTIAEAGIPGYSVEGWFGLFAPTSVPKEIVTKLNTAVVRILKDPKVKELLLTQGAEPAPSSPEEFAAFVRKERERWARVIRESNITLE